jgi:hypothetical protein
VVVRMLVVGMLLGALHAANARWSDRPKWS